jgi:hypothetical protein
VNGACSQHREEFTTAGSHVGSRMLPDDRSRITTTLKRLKIKRSEMFIDEYFMNFEGKR